MTTSTDFSHVILETRAQASLKKGRGTCLDVGWAPLPTSVPLESMLAMRITQFRGIFSLLHWTDDFVAAHGEGWSHRGSGCCWSPSLCECLLQRAPSIAVALEACHGWHRFYNGETRQVDKLPCVELHCSYSFLYDAFLLPLLGILRHILVVSCLWVSHLAGAEGTSMPAPGCMRNCSFLNYFRASWK